MQRSVAWAKRYVLVKDTVREVPDEIFSLISEKLTFGCALFSNVESHTGMIQKYNNHFICSLLLYKLQMLLY